MGDTSCKNPVPLWHCISMAPVQCAAVCNAGTDLLTSTWLGGITPCLETDIHGFLIAENAGVMLIFGVLMTGKAAQILLKSPQLISVKLDSGVEWCETKTNTLIDKASPAVTELQQSTGGGACPGFCKQRVSSVTVTHIRDEQGRRSQRAWSVEISPAARVCLKGFGLAHSSEESLYF